MVALSPVALFGKKAAPPPPAKTEKKSSGGFGKKAAPAPAKAPPAKFGGFGKKAAPAKKAPPAKTAPPAPEAAPTKVAPKKTIKKAAPIKKGGSSAQAGSDLSKWYGSGRKLYLPGGLLSLDNDVPSYLNGTLAGDYGFDPLGLGADGNVDNYREAELIHARWAMLALPGIVIPEALNIPGSYWLDTGKVFLDGEAGRPEILQNPVLFAAIQVVLMGAAENFRQTGEGPAGFVPFKGKFDESAFKGLDSLNPGGPLDFFNVASTPEDLALLKVKEIKNGRLAMVAMLGVFVQGLVTAEGPAANWGKHVADPFGYNFVTLTAVERTPVL